MKENKGILKLQKEQNKENIKPFHLIETDNDKKTRSGKESAKPHSNGSKSKIPLENASKSRE